MVDPFLNIYQEDDNTSYSIKFQDILFPPILPSLMIQRTPILSFPPIGTLYSYRSGVSLFWDSLTFMDSYHIQVSTDSLFSQRSIDTVLKLTTLPLLPLIALTQYFWRVSGMNTAGESPWSEVWDFWTGATAEVIVTNKSKLSLSSFPNPTSKELNISYVLPERGNARLFLYDLEGRIMRENMMDADQGEHRMQWDVSGLPSGSYVLGLMTEKATKSEIVKIVR